MEREWQKAGSLPCVLYEQWIDLSQARIYCRPYCFGEWSVRKVALQQLKGGISQEISVLRNDLLNFVSLIELELILRKKMWNLPIELHWYNCSKKIETKLKSLIDSFQYGNAIKSGVAVAIIGKPNAGKSTLLNALLKEEKSHRFGYCRNYAWYDRRSVCISKEMLSTHWYRRFAWNGRCHRSNRRGKSQRKVAQADVLVYLIDVATTDLKDDLAMLHGELAREDLKIIICLTKIDEVEQVEKAKTIAKILQSEIPSWVVYKFRLRKIFIFRI